MRSIDLTDDMDQVRAKLNEMRQKLIDVCREDDPTGRSAAFYDGYYDAVIDLLDNAPTLAP